MKLSVGRPITRTIAPTKNMPTPMTVSYWHFRDPYTAVRVKAVKLPESSPLAKRGIGKFELYRELDFNDDRGTLNMFSTNGRTIARGRKAIREVISKLKSIKDDNEAAKYLEQQIAKRRYIDKLNYPHS